MLIGYFKTGDKFNIDSSAIKASVSNQQVLNQQQSVNGRNVSVSGEMVDTYWAKMDLEIRLTSLLLVEPTVTIKSLV
ncbi:MAG: hypothetical protein ACLTZB_03165 [Streptococcus salivarius]